MRPDQARLRAALAMLERYYETGQYVHLRLLADCNPATPELAALAATLDRAEMLLALYTRRFFGDKVALRGTVWIVTPNGNRGTDDAS